MPDYTVYKMATGEIMRFGSVPEFIDLGSHIALNSDEGLIAKLPPPGVNWRVVGQEFAPIPPQPDHHYTMDWSTLTWTDARPLEQVRIDSWRAIKAQRELFEFDGFSWDGSAFDSDPQAQARIQGGVQLATIAASQSQPFSIDWTLADNTVRTLSGADMIAVGMTLAGHVQTVHAIARTLRLQIEAATTLAEVEAVVWP